jgi:hypothetical protein
MPDPRSDARGSASPEEEGGGDVLVIGEAGVARLALVKAELDALLGRVRLLKPSRVSVLAAAVSGDEAGGREGGGREEDGGGGGGGAHR